MKTKAFNSLVAAIKEAGAHHRGERSDLRTTILPEPPRPMSSAEIKKLRARINVSQPVFASCLNVSAKLVQAWESGVRSPKGSALKLLRIAEVTPEVVFAFKGHAKVDRDRRALVDALMSPPRPNPALRKAFAKYRKETAA